MNLHIDESTRDNDNLANRQDLLNKYFITEACDATVNLNNLPMDFVMRRQFFAISVDDVPQLT